MKRSDEVRRVLRANLLVLGIFAAACYRTPSSMTDSGDPRCLDCNVILISIDTLRADHLSCYGYPRRTSPEIDRFAKESSVFSQVVSTGGGTLPVHLSMMTSLPPTVHDVWPRHPTRLAEARVTLAEELRSRGYATAGFVDSGWMLAKFGFDQGFDVYDDAGGHFKKILPKAVDWLEEHRRSKFFLFLHTYDVHSAFKRLPYDSPDPYNDLYTAGYLGPFWGCRQGICASRLLARMNAEMTVGAVKPHEVLGDRELAYIVALYDGGINHVDDQIGKILRKIRNLGLERNTIVALTSDHGEEFLEHGRLLHSQYFEEVARIPLLFRVPRASVRPRTIPDLASTLDTMPTILDLLGLKPNPEARGRSLLPLMMGDPLPAQPVLISWRKEKLRNQGWSLIVANGDATDLYDLTNDPGERVNVIAEHAAATDDLLANFRRMRTAELEHKMMLQTVPNPETEMTSEEVEKLRALGYVN